MSSKRIVVIFGATGNQGGSVVNSILNDSLASHMYLIRAVTRDVSKPAAKTLADKGAEVVEGNLNDKGSLRKVLKAAYAVFAVTNFVELRDMDTEVQQGKNVADVSKELGIQHLIWSSLPNVSSITKGKYTKVYAFDGKAQVEEYIRQTGVPATYLIMGCFFTFPLFMLSLDPSTAPKKSYKLDMPVPPSTKWSLISANTDTGKYVKGILAHREKVLGKRIPAAVRDYTVEEIAHILNEKGGVPVSFQQISTKDFKKKLAAKGLPGPSQDTITEAQLFGAESGFLGGLDVTWADVHDILLEPLETFENWVLDNPLLDQLK